MYNPFSENRKENVTDEQLIVSVANGDKQSLELLVNRHQNWIYNIILHMVNNSHDAKDITQEVLIKIITKLGTFRRNSNFRTWLYRIVINHCLSFKRNESKKSYSDKFKKYAREIDNSPDAELPDKDSLPVDSDIIVEEVKLTCLHGMLLCLDEKHRIVFILGSVLYIPDKVGAEIMNISYDNYRKRLSRARKDIYNFMNEKCGLINPANACLCSRKTKALIDSNYINPHQLVFNSNYSYRIEQVIGKKLNDLDTFFDEKCEKLFSEYPFQNSPDFVMYLRKLLETKKFKEIFNFN